MDETGIYTVKKGRQNPWANATERGRICNKPEETKNICCDMNASGIYTPPMFIYSRIRMTCWKWEGLKGGQYMCNCWRNGWLNRVHILARTFHKTYKEDPVLLILVHHSSSHRTIDLYEFNERNGIVEVSIHNFPWPSEMCLEQGIRLFHEVPPPSKYNAIRVCM